MAEISDSQIRDYVKEWLKNPKDREKPLPDFGSGFRTNRDKFRKELAKTSKGRAMLAYYSKHPYERQENRRRANHEEAL